MKTFKRIIISLLSLFAGLFLVLLGIFIAAVVSNINVIDENIKFQEEHLEYLETAYYKNYTPKNEADLADFDLEKAIEDGVKLNEIAILGTHNSYQRLATAETRFAMNIVDTITFKKFGLNTFDFQMDTLTGQLEMGIRNVEIDIETLDKDNKIEFKVTHNTIVDNASSAYDFTKALTEIKMWSDNNPGHIPVIVIVEPKSFVIEINGMKKFSLGYAKELDKIIENTLGDSLLTPKDVLRNYASFKEMRENDDWISLKEAQGKILVLLHDCDVTESYIALDESIKTQKMFPMLRYDDRNESYTSFILENDPWNADSRKAETIDECNLIVRTRADKYPDFSDERYEITENCGSQIITTDFPEKVNGNESHSYSFDGKKIKRIKS
ncbi:MAG: phosphatidylinositol-specific phospholipase C domain-containing protein [Ruminococcaceae bacterium]|nr:phosphatidylinositol-specific phospholipase C domain-containing protein [Oscillospiraceae bacterium]